MILIFNLWFYFTNNCLELTYGTMDAVAENSKTGVTFLYKCCTVQAEEFLALIPRSIRHFFPTMMGLKVNEGNKLQCKMTVRSSGWSNSNNNNSSETDKKHLEKFRKTWSYNWNFYCFVRIDSTAVKINKHH